MRRNGPAPSIIALAIWLVALAWPACALAVLAFGDTPQADSGTYVPIRPLSELLLTSTGYALGVALLACCFGWFPGLLLGRCAGGRFHALIAAGMLLPICLPAYVV